MSFIVPLDQIREKDREQIGEKTSQGSIAKEKTEHRR